MLRDITIKQFQDGLRENLVPNLKKYGGSEYLDTFMTFFEDKSIVKGGVIPLLWSGQLIVHDFVLLLHISTITCTMHDAFGGHVLLVRLSCM